MFFRLTNKPDRTFKRFPEFYLYCWQCDMEMELSGAYSENGISTFVGIPEIKQYMCPNCHGGYNVSRVNRVKGKFDVHDKQLRAYLGEKPAESKSLRGFKLTGAVSSNFTVSKEIDKRYRNNDELVLW